MCEWQSIQTVRFITFWLEQNLMRINVFCFAMCPEESGQNKKVEENRIDRY